ncbi:MAG TPA: SGNH/GDSL hydrolase family protein [Armatimonadota bacterium]|nr:SGNH/GDSL hydrolase family protein [Armatimonadota bacterium]
MKIIQLFLLGVLLWTIPLSASVMMPSWYTTPDSGLCSFFAKLEHGDAVTIVGLGGSITQANPGWLSMTAETLQQQFPQAKVQCVNSGISGTGSDLGVFRLRKDVIDKSPDLVFVEFAVNDGALSNDDAILYMESIVQRLERLPKPPAIVIIDSAARTTSIRSRHQKVAQQYGLLEIDMQRMIDAYRQEHPGQWTDLYNDDVHPNRTGHTLYAAAITDTMAQLRATFDRTHQIPATTKLPKPLSKQPLLLDAELLPFTQAAAGWALQPLGKQQSWFEKYCGNVLTSTAAGSTLQMPFYGRAFGLWFPQGANNGKFRLTIDGENISECETGLDRTYSLRMFDNKLKPGWHALSLAVIPAADGKVHPVQLAYYMVEKQPKEQPSARKWQQLRQAGYWTIEKLTKSSWTSIPATTWRVLGTFGGEAPTPWKEPQLDMNRDYGVKSGVVDNRTYTGTQGRTVQWRQGQGTGNWVDLAGMTGFKDRGVSYACVVLDSPKAQQITCRLAMDYFARGFVNGHQAFETLEGHGGAQQPNAYPIQLQKGHNTIWLVIHSGSAGNGFAMDFDAESGIHSVDVTTVK